jgi:regulator of nucleoside diphosphate kinase
MLTEFKGPSRSTKIFTMKKSIYITSQDKQRLEDLLAEAEARDPSKREELKGLREEVQRALIVNPKEIPPDVITMNSRAELCDLDTGERVVFTLVFPWEADVDLEKISILAPIGSGMLGYRVGDEFEWKVPEGVRRMKVVKVYYQPEAAGDFHR